jgi:DNA repair protein RecO (recombination protein O)
MSSRLYNDHGVVLRTYRLGEADRIVVLLTRAHGKVRAVAKGVRKTKSRFGARLEPTTHVAVLFHEGRELDIVSQAEAVDQFRDLREDLDRFARASAMLEVVDQIAPEREPNPALYTMLVGALRTLDARDAPLVVPGFFLKVLALEGVGPSVDVCVACGTAEDLVAFDPGEGGLLCAAHRRGVGVSADAVALLRLVLGGQLSAALDAPASAATREVDALATRAIEHHIERRVKSVTLLEH